MAKKKLNLFTNEDWWAVWIGLLIFLLSLGVFKGIDILGWAVKTDVWLSLRDAVKPISEKYAHWHGLTSLFATYLFLLVIMTIGAKVLGMKLGKFVVGFSIVFWFSYVCWVAGHFAYIAATSDKLGKFGILWSLNLTGEAGFIIALIVGLIIGNFFPRFAGIMSEAARNQSGISKRR